MQPSYQSGFYAPGRGVAKHPELWRGCVGAWNPGLGNTGLSLRDWSGNSNNGVPSNALMWDTSGGRNTVLCNATNERVLAPNVGSFISGAVGMTASIWVTLVADTSFDRGFMGTWATQFVFVWWGGGGTVLFASNSPTTQTNTIVGNSFTVGQIHHIAAVVTPTSQTVYIDGVAKGESARSGLIRTGPAQLEVGTYSLRTDVVETHYNDWRVYNRALSPNEVRTLAQHPGIAYELAPRKTYFIPAATNTSQFYDVLSPLIFAGTN